MPEGSNSFITGKDPGHDAGGVMSDLAIAQKKGKHYVSERVEPLSRRLYQPFAQLGGEDVDDGDNHHHDDDHR